MLVLSRKEGDTIHISGGIVITVTSIQGSRVKLGITAPPEVSIVRGELKRTMEEFRGPDAPPAHREPVETTAAEAAVRARQTAAVA